jgi:hypothetical protein
VTFNDKGVVCLEQGVHLLHLLRGEGLDDVQLVVRCIKFSTTSSRRGHWTWSLCQGLHVGRVHDAKPLAQVPEHQGAVLLHLAKIGSLLVGANHVYALQTPAQ